MLDWLTGSKKLMEIESPINGKLEVIRDIVWGTYIKAGGLTQSGGIAESVWRKTLIKINTQEFKPRTCLILGLGGGSIAKTARHLWPGIQITGVDVDSLIVELGKKYLGLGSYVVDIKITDAFEFCQKEKSKYDLILIDVYQGDTVPEKLRSENFVKNIQKLMSKNGISVFNRLFGGRHRPDAVKFLKKLEKVFPNCDAMYPEANVMYICKN